MTTWNYKQGEDDALNRLEVPRAARKDGATRQHLLGLLQPRHLMTTMESLADSAPAPLGPYIREIFPLIPPGSGAVVDVYADAPGSKSRLITCTQAFASLLIVSVSLFEEMEAPVRAAAGQILKARDKEILPPLEALQMIGELASGVNARLIPDQRRDDLIRLLTSARVNAAGLAHARDKVFNAREPSEVTHAYLDAALRFVMAHETSHHLLNHTWKKPNNEAPGALVLSRWLSELEMSPLPASTGQDHREEYEADAMALLLTTRQKSGDPEKDYFSSLITVAGCFFSLPALSLVDEIAPGEVSEPSISHPSLIDRGARLSELLIRTCAPNPAPPTMAEIIDREITGSPPAFGLQLWLTIATIARRMEEFEATASLRQSS